MPLQAKLLEHNVRFGDPECQCLMMRLKSDLLEMLLAATSEQLGQIKPQWSPEAALTVVLAAKGYPGSYAKNTPIRGLEDVSTAKVRCCTIESSAYVNEHSRLSLLAHQSASRSLSLASTNKGTIGDALLTEVRVGQ